MYAEVLIMAEHASAASEALSNTTEWLYDAIAAQTDPNEQETSLLLTLAEHVAAEAMRIATLTACIEGGLK